MTIVATGLMVPIMETACGPTRANAALSMNEGSTVDATAMIAASQSTRGGAERPKQAVSGQKSKITLAQARKHGDAREEARADHATSGRAVN